MDRSAWIGAAHRRIARSTYPSCTHPGDERRQLPPQAEPPQTHLILRALNDTPPNAPRGRRSSSATLQRPFYPAYLQQNNSYLLAYFYSVPVAQFYSALDTWVFSIRESTSCTEVGMCFKLQTTGCNAPCDTTATSDSLRIPSVRNL